MGKNNSDEYTKEKNNQNGMISARLDWKNRWKREVEPKKPKKQKLNYYDDNNNTNNKKKKRVKIQRELRPAGR